MTPLPTIIRKDGFELMLMRRQGRAAIYRQHRPGSDPRHDAYEVILPQVRDTNHKGQLVEPYEGYPAVESWGTKGWTFSTLGEAVQKLLQLSEKTSQKVSRARTVSRRNRRSGRGGIRSRLSANPSQKVRSGRNSASPRPTSLSPFPQKVSRTSAIQHQQQ
jgi:hypothetical protein